MEELREIIGRRIMMIQVSNYHDRAEISGFYSDVPGEAGKFIGITDKSAYLTVVGPDFEVSGFGHTVWFNGSKTVIDVKIKEKETTVFVDVQVE